MPAVAALSRPVVAPSPRSEVRPFLKWVGGKRRVLHALMPHIPDGVRTYHEPFVGGGALFFALAARERPPQGAVLSDMNHRLVRTYRGLKNQIAEVLDRLSVHEAAHCKEHYYETRATDVDRERSDAAVAAWMIYLNKTGFNGLYRVNRKGGFNVPIGSYTNPVIRDVSNLMNVHRVLQTVEIRHGDFKDSFFKAQAGDVVYFDPPYIPLSKTASFTAYTRHGFGPDQQVELRDLALELKRRGVHVILSNHDCPEIRELYAEFDVTQVMVGRAINSKASKRGAVAEVVIT